MDTCYLSTSLFSPITLYEIYRYCQGGDSRIFSAHPVNFGWLPEKQVTALFSKSYRQFISKITYIVNQPVSLQKKRAVA